MRGLAIVSLLVAGGCVGGSFNGDMAAATGNDLSAPMQAGPDMTMVFAFDLAGFDLSGLSNCGALNMCEKGQTPAKALMCEQNATPTARAKEGALQACFKKYCPLVADMAMGICAANDMGQVSAMCANCINNTYVGQGAACEPPDAPECHMCLHEAQVCLGDQ